MSRKYQYLTNNFLEKLKNLNKIIEYWAFTRNYLHAMEVAVRFSKCTVASVR